jgi:2-hydroxy-3-oxopropionate reductase
VTLPVAALVEQMFGALEAKGRGGWDHSALITLIEEGSGEEAR